MIYLIKRTFGKFFQLLWMRLPINLRIKYIMRLISLESQGRSSRDILCSLYEIDIWLQKQIDKVAINYEGGIHPKYRLTRYHDFFIEKIKATDRVLDIGCGNGFVAYNIAKKTKAIVVGIDLDVKKISFAERNYKHLNLRFLIGDALVDLPKERFDVVILSNILEHISERNSFLNRLLRNIKPQRILIRVPMFDRHWSVPLRKELGVNLMGDATHCTMYTKESFTGEMEASNLRAVDLKICWGEIWAEVWPKQSV